ncbi:FAD binding domain-containing protein [Daldinia sp. FL1419]|nr:FAD binding domain-containing protein [Daldinia sp. FL1419]
MYMHLYILSLILEINVFVAHGLRHPSLPGFLNTGGGNITEDLLARLSPGASVSTDLDSAPRWSDYHRPRAGYVVRVAEERDVAETVKYCNEHDLKFLAQAGGHGWADTFSMSDNDVIINLRSLNHVSLNEAKDVVSFGGGVLGGEVIAKAAANNVTVSTGGFNCVGYMGITLGGGIGRWMNKYGLNVDNLLSVNLVTAEGETIHVSPTSHAHLDWAIRGAGQNFGIVTSATMKAHPMRGDDRVWVGDLFYPAEKLEKYIEIFNTLNMTEEMTIHWRIDLTPPNNTPVIAAQVFFMNADVEAAHAAFKPLYDLEPYKDTTEVIPYGQVNDARDFACVHGPRKPVWGAGLKSLDYEAFQTLWDEYADFVAKTGITSTIIGIDAYSNYATRQFGSKHASYSQRDVNFFALIVPIYEDASLDPAVEAFGSRVRELWLGSSGYDIPKIYQNFAHGDEPLEWIYGDSLPRLQQLKKKWDPRGRFNQWFAITTPEEREL